MADVGATVTARAPDHPSPVRPADVGARPPSCVGRRLCRTCLTAVGVGLAVITAEGGSTLGRFIRPAVILGMTLVGLAVLGSGRRWLCMVIATAAGFAGTSVGLGVGLPHLVKHSEWSVVVAGMISLIGGVLLLANTSVAVTRRVRWWWRPPLGLTVLVVTYVVLATLGPAIAATNVPHDALGPATPATMGLPYLDVDVPTTDGVILAGWYVPSTNGAAIVLLHGAGSTRTAVLDHASVLAGRGYGVLMIDARGHGKSGGRAMDLGWYGDEDVAAAVSFLRSRPDVDVERIAAVGLSMGGEQAIGALGTVDGLAAVVAEGATGRVAADHDWLSDEHGLRGWVQEVIDDCRDAVAGMLTDANEPPALRDAVAASQRPILLIVAGQVADEADAARRLQAAAPERVEVWTVAGAEHTGGLDADPVRWERRVTSFLERAVGTGSG